MSYPSFLVRAQVHLSCFRRGLSSPLSSRDFFLGELPSYRHVQLRDQLYFIDSYFLLLGVHHFRIHHCILLKQSWLWLYPRILGRARLSYSSCCIKIFFPGLYSFFSSIHSSIWGLIKLGVL